VQRTTTWPRLAVAFAALALAGLIAFVLLAGGSGAKSTSATPAAAGPVKVRLSDFKIAPSASSAAAGRVTFVATDAGRVTHEMIVVRTDGSPRSLLKGARASEAGSVGEIGEFKPGLTKRVTLSLKPGRYVLLCNIPGHFKAGMYTTFTVR
jgi:uncharacterized cupredoxin-like copper-binding protein